jgi:hypothetical protein
MTKVNGVSNDERDGLICALSFGIPVARNQGVKFRYIWWRNETTEKTISDTDTFALGWALGF